MSDTASALEQLQQEKLRALRTEVLATNEFYQAKLGEIGLRPESFRLGGASVPNVRRRIEEAWGMHCVDHAGAQILSTSGRYDLAPPTSLGVCPTNRTHS